MIARERKSLFLCFFVTRLFLQSRLVQFNEVNTSQVEENITFSCLEENAKVILRSRDVRVIRNRFEFDFELFENFGLREFKDKHFVC